MTMKRDGKVLVVEESSKIMRAIEDAADRVPYVCEHASDGWEAIEKLEQEDYEAIVIDCDLPRQSGFGVLTYLREENGDRMNNVIVVACESEDVRRKLSSESVRVVERDDAVTALLTVASERSIA
jgi:DNA-binding response OmpR family regulator